MDFSHSEKVRDLQERISQFMDQHVYPAEPLYHREVQENRRAGNPWQATKVVEDLKKKARAADLWNLFLPHSEHGAGLTNLEYAPLCEIMGRSHIAPEAFNCSAPDTGNMEVLARYATKAQQQRWLAPLLDGKIRSAFAMTEPSVASSDATNIQASIVRDGDSYVINGRKWWTSGAGDPRCEILIFMGKTNPEAGRHSQQSMILVPMKTPGVKVLRALSVFGYDHAPHGHAEVDFVNVRVPVENLLLGEGRGFEIAQGRLGPGRIHHCMRTIGVAERALELMCKRAQSRVAFGKKLSEQGVTLERIAEARIMIDQTRWLVLNAAYGSGLVIAGKVFPFCFITIACGSISGFHALIASGTTPKLITREGYARPIGYGAMCFESFVAIMALIAACTLDPGVYFSMNVKGDPAATVAKVTALGFPVTVDQMQFAGESAWRKNLVWPHRRRGDAGRRHGAHFFQGRQRPLARPLVSLRHHVRGAVHPDDARRRHARGALFDCKASWAAPGNRSATRRISRHARRRRADGRRVGIFSDSRRARPAGRHQLALAAVRHRQPDARRHRAVSGHDDHFENATAEGRRVAVGQIESTAEIGTGNAVPPKAEAGARAHHFDSFGLAARGDVYRRSAENLSSGPTHRVFGTGKIAQGTGN